MLTALRRHHDLARPPTGARRGRRSFWRLADAVGGRRAFASAACGGWRERARRGPAPIVRTGELGPRAGKPETVVDLVGERQRSADVRARLFGQRDRRRAGRRNGEDHGGGLARRRAGSSPCRRRGSSIASRSAAVRRGVALRIRRADPALDPGLDQARVAAHDEDRIFGNDESLRIGAILKSTTSGGRPAYGGGSIQASMRLVAAAAAIASPDRQSKAAASRPYISGPADDGGGEGERARRRSAWRKGRARPCAARAARREPLSTARPSRARCACPERAGAPDRRRRWRACRRARKRGGGLSPASRSSRVSDVAPPAAAQQRRAARGRRSPRRRTARRRPRAPDGARIANAPSHAPARKTTPTTSAKTSGGHARSTSSTRRASLDSDPSAARASGLLVSGLFTVALRSRSGGPRRARRRVRCEFRCLSNFRASAP